MKEQIREYLTELLIDVAATDTNIVLLAILLVVIVIVLDAVSMFAREKRKKVGLDSATPEVQVRGRESLPVRLYVSDMQGLAGKPDALISENGFIIPVERKPLAKKIRDRYVAQLLVYMRLVEEFEGKRPPYGYLVLGPNCRRVKIQNTQTRQNWLQKHLDQMQSILQQRAEAQPEPHPRKCRKCSVRNSCSHRTDSAAQPSSQPQQAVSS